MLGYEGLEVINPEGGKEDAEEEAQKGRWKQEVCFYFISLCWFLDLKEHRLKIFKVSLVCNFSYEFQSELCFSCSEEEVMCFMSYNSVIKILLPVCLMGITSLFMCI